VQPADRGASDMHCTRVGRISSMNRNYAIKGKKQSESESDSDNLLKFENNV